ncbi:Phophatidylserine decarboxylase-domain-containing protein [Diplogelasinospora grovesii]|uniref:Phophatidylserine decarboxylase-domain-containing protein n=1 Tax=Diplogelasinospora grovesii TaxID=303347 RepID=A0AAN6RZQ2_9PEZI|nr:Phophatidylserine decarboxylase-domain-containing protein [Diplogelasinospora grovesii]
MPRDPEHWRPWLKKTLQHVRAKHRMTKDVCHDSIKQLWSLIEDNPDVRLLFTLMLEQVPIIPPYNENPAGGPEFRDWKELLCAFDHQLTQGPLFLYTTEGEKGLIGFPFNAFLDWPMGTPAGISLFLRADVNACIRNMLNEYGSFLQSAKSTHVLNDGAEGWFNGQALSAMSEVADPPPHTKPFSETFTCDPSAPSYGFRSWDDFFVRRFRDSERPVYAPQDDNVIVNACESGPLALCRGVNLSDDFWLKGQPYSLSDMLGASNASPFAGGTVYQAFLSALSYHRWHAPLSGRVAKVEHIPGTYYAENYWEGFANPDGPDPAAPNNSQRYICQVASRALLMIEADNPAVGLMGILFVGMAEVSSCEVLVKPGDYVKKGQDIGMFHFGGSTHVLIFRPGVRLDFVGAAANPDPEGDGGNLPVRGELATVVTN